MKRRQRNEDLSNKRPTLFLLLLCFKIADFYMCDVSVSNMIDKV